MLSGNFFLKYIKVIIWIDFLEGEMKLRNESVGCGMSLKDS